MSLIVAGVCSVRGTAEVGRGQIMQVPCLGVHLHPRGCRSHRESSGRGAAQSVLYINHCGIDAG